MLIGAKDYAQLFLEDRPLLDVRAEIEFRKGAFPTAVNIPILNDSEREQIGIIYKQHGSEQATEAGYQMVSGARKSERIEQWQEFINHHPGAYLYCFRGGQRSKIACEWLAASGLDVARIDGGYKAMRRFLIDGIEDWVAATGLYVLGGKTGTGKTRVLHRFEAQLDLEAMACHRGSAFGKRLIPQPTQINFENILAIRLLKLNHAKYRRLLVEDESNLIGRLKVPAPLFDKMNSAELIIIEDHLKDRVKRIYDEYITEQLAEYKNVHESEDTAFKLYSQSLLSSLQGIAKRLGGARYTALQKLMTEALNKQQQGQAELHKEWITELLTNYYDPMYAYQLESKKPRVIFSGSQEEIIEWLDASGLFARVQDRSECLYYS